MSSLDYEAYVAAAEQVGLASREDGLLLVGDAYEEPLTGRRQCLIEYWYAEDDNRAGRRLLAAAQQRWPDCQEVLVRTTAPLGTPFKPWLSYLVTEPGKMPAAAVPEDIQVVPAGRRHREAIRGMLREAFERGCRDQGWEPVDRRVGQVVAKVLDAPDRVTFVAERSGSCVAHATLLTEARDEPTGKDYIELLDVLVGEAEQQRAVQAALVAACAAYAAAEGRALLGHVVHDTADPPRVQRIIGGLRQQGWRVIHHYELAPLEAGHLQDAST